MQQTGSHGITVGANGSIQSPGTRKTAPGSSFQTPSKQRQIESCNLIRQPSVPLSSSLTSSTSSALRTAPGASFQTPSVPRKVELTLARQQILPERGPSETSAAREIATGASFPVPGVQQQVGFDKLTHQKTTSRQIIQTPGTYDIRETDPGLSFQTLCTTPSSFIAPTMIHQGPAPEVVPNLQELSDQYKTERIPTNEMMYAPSSPKGNNN